MKPGTRYITVNDVKETDADRRRDGTAFPLAQRQMERNAAPREGSTQESWPNLKVARLIFRGGIPHRDTETAGADY
jgi:hypothetical protein